MKSITIKTAVAGISCIVTIILIASVAILENGAYFRASEENLGTE